MKRRDYLPTTYVALVSFLTNLLNLVSAAQARLGINAAKLAEFQAAVNAYLAAFAIADHPSATNVDRLTRANRAKEAKEVTRKFVNSELRYNDDLTDEDRLDMGLTIPDHTPTPVPVPETYPNFDIDTSVIRRLTVAFRDQGSEKRAKPYGIHGAEIAWALLSTPPTHVKDLVHSAFSTKWTHSFTFEEDERGEKVYFALRWENTKGEKGPWSEIAKAIIP